ncbi:MAG: hypothetical protein IKD46_09250 [Lentisphaeria bacterium]|nr:hypothetical protein [Lentisphaeria bacterium]
MNYGKLAMLHRLAGGGPITIYQSERPEDLQKIYCYLQELCNDSREVRMTGQRIVTRNPLLAWHLKEVVEYQTVVIQ